MAQDIKTGDFSQVEVEADFAATLRDINALQRIVDGINAFMTDTHGEDRSFYKADLFKYQGLLTQAERLKDKINKYRGEHFG